MTKKIFILSVIAFACIAIVPQQWQDNSGWVFIPSGDGAVIQSALDAGFPSAGNRYGKTIVLGQGVWSITEPLRINEREGVTIVGAGNSLNGTILQCNTPDRACIEILGSDNIILQNLNITGVDMAVGIMTSRTLAYMNSSRIEFRDLYVYGFWDYAAFYNVSSESNTLYNVHANAQNPLAESVVTIAPVNEYGIVTSIPIQDGIGAYSPIIERSGLTGKSRVPLRIFGWYATVRDAYLYTPDGRAAIELIGGGSLRLENSGFEGAPLVSIRLTKRDGYQNYFTLNIDSGLGSPSQYAIWADDGTVVKESAIGAVGEKPIRLWDMVYVDMSRFGAFDSRQAVVTANKCFGVTILLGQNDVFTCAQYIGVTIHNQSSFWAPKMEYKGFAP